LLFVEHTISSDGSMIGAVVLGVAVTHFMALHSPFAPHDPGSPDAHASPTFRVASQAPLFALHHTSFARLQVKPRAGAGPEPLLFVMLPLFVPMHGLSPALPSMTS
jgi:hypothetical protein